MNLDKAITSLKQGEFILLHDSHGRENEVDMVVAAEFVTPEHIARMRKYAGGLICLAVDNAFASQLHLRYMHDILSDLAQIDPPLNDMVSKKAAYGDHPTFSLSINHKKTYTGITDLDRAFTIRELASLYGVQSEEKRQMFLSSFKAPGHVPLLIASNGLLSKRQGHTEMSIYLTKIAELKPVCVVCEMLDSETYKALSLDKAKKFANENAIPLVEAQELLESSKVQ